MAAASDPRNGAFCTFQQLALVSPKWECVVSTISGGPLLRLPVEESLNDVTRFGEKRVSPAKKEEGRKLTVDH